MSVGVSALTNPMFLHYLNQQKKASAKGIDFASARLSAKQAEKTDAAEQAGLSKTEQYTEYLKQKYGNIIVKSVGSDQKSMDKLGASTFGTDNVVIAPNILEKMANDPERAAYYESQIQWHFDSLPRLEAQLSAMGHEIHSCGLVIHPDGTVTQYVCGDLKPEVRAKIEARVKAEQEAKRKRRQQYAEQSKEAAANRRRMNDIYSQQRIHEIMAAYEKNLL